MASLNATLCLLLLVAPAASLVARSSSASHEAIASNTVGSRHKLVSSRQTVNLTYLTHHMKRVNRSRLNRTGSKLNRTWDGVPSDVVWEKLPPFLNSSSAEQMLPDLRFSNTNVSAALVFGVRNNGEGDLAAAESAIKSYGLMAIITALTFTLLRKHCSTVYCREKTATAPSDASNDDFGYFWPSAVASLTAESVIETSGLDAWMFLEFCSFCQWLLTVLGPILIVLFCPLYYFIGWNDTPVTERANDSLNRMTMGRLKSSSVVYWCAAAAVWIVVYVVTYRIQKAHTKFLELRFAWLRRIPPPRANTVMVENIPAQYRSDEALKQYFQEVFSDQEVIKAYVVRRTRVLRTKVQHYASLVYQEVIGMLPQGLVQRAETDVSEERARLEEAIAAGNASAYSATGFVTFRSNLAQRLASNEQYTSNPEELVVDLPPDPYDVRYTDLEAWPEESQRWTTAGYTCIIAIFILWVPVVTFISTLTDLAALKATFPSMKRFCDDNPASSSFLQGVLSTAALNLFMAILPSILLWIIHTFFTLKAGAWAQLRLEQWYFAFLVIFVLLVTTLSSSLLRTVTELIDQPTKVFTLLAGGLPDASHFYFNYLVLGWFIVAFRMIRITTLVKYVFFRWFFSLDTMTAKKYSEKGNSITDGMGQRMAATSLMFTITLVFCTCHPLICLPAVIYFFLARAAHGYLLVFAETRMADLGGVFWVNAMKQVYIGLCLYVFLMVGVSTHASYQGPAILASASLLLVRRSWMHFHQRGWESLPLEQVIEVHKTMIEGGVPYDGEYIQPEMKPVRKQVQTFAHPTASLQATNRDDVDEADAPRTPAPDACSSKPVQGA